MMKRYAVLGIIIALVVSIAAIGCSGSSSSGPTPQPKTATAVPTIEPTPTPTPYVAIPQGMGAIIGKVTWGGNPLANSTVDASTKHPAIVIPPWGTTASYKDFTITTDANGDYIMFVDPETYYVGCGMPGSQYLSYSSWGVLLYDSYTVELGEVVTANLKAIDWSIELISPGETWSNNPPITSNYPTLIWESYDWGKYGGVSGYYMVEMGTIRNGYQQLLRQKTYDPLFNTAMMLDDGEYLWKVEAYTSDGIQIAGSPDDFYFNISIE